MGVEVVKVDAYKCTVCGRIWYDEGCARRCCTCSECGCTVEGGDELGADIQHGAWNYCPNCRAKVRKEIER